MTLMISPTKALSEVELRLLEHCEGMLKGAILYQGEALKHILDNALYRAEYVTFSAYVHGKWGMSPSYAYQTIGHYDTYKETGASLTHHAHYRALEQASSATLQLVADLLPKLDKISAKAITALISVVNEAIETGAIEAVEGEQLRLDQISAIQAAALLEQAESLKRQITHLSTKRKPIATFSGIAMEYFGAGLRGIIGLDSDVALNDVEVFKDDKTFSIRGKLK